MQPLTHSGPRTPTRIISRQVSTARVIQELHKGVPIVDQLHDVLKTIGSDSGFAEVHGGVFAPLSYCIPDVATAERALSFSETRSRPSSSLIYGSVTLGLRDGEPYMHSHCFWQSQAGELEGGHLWLDTAAGFDPPIAVVTAVLGARWSSATDPETLMPVFTPEKGNETMTRPATDLDTVISRVLPNEDITEALLEVCRKAGFKRASVRAGLGSLVGATLFDRVSGQNRVVEGPATEVIALIGDVHLVGDALVTRLSCTLVDRHGEIHVGELVPGENLVAATFELTVQRVDEIGARVS